MELTLFTMPATARILFFSTLFALSHALPWSGPEPTASYIAAKFNPRETSTPQLGLVKRQNAPSSTCGWIGGLSNSPVICPGGTTCVWDSGHSVVGCCQIGQDCTQAIYTSCVDGNSPSATADANIRTCGGGNVCYRNTYPGGYYQYGCGASSQDAIVQTTYSGQDQNNALFIVHTSISLSGVTSTSVPTSSSSSSPSSTTSSSSQSTTSSGSLSGPVSDYQNKMIGIITGSVIGGIAVVCAIVGLACFCIRRRARGQNTGIYMRRDVEDKVLYFGNKTSITSSSRGSYDISVHGPTPDIEQVRAPSSRSNHTMTSASSHTVTQPVMSQPIPHLQVQTPQNEIVSPITSPQISAPVPNIAAQLEAHPGEPWSNVPISPPTNAIFTLFSQRSTVNPNRNRISSAPEPRRITLTDAPYDDRPQGLSRSSTVSSYGSPPTPPVRSPLRMSQHNNLAQQIRTAFQPSPTFQLQEPEPQVSHVEVSMSKKGSPRADGEGYPSYSYAKYSQLKEEGESPPTPEAGPSHDYIHEEAGHADAEPGLRRYISNGSTMTAISVFSASSRYSRDISGLSRAASRASIHPTGRSITSSTSNSSLNATLSANTTVSSSSGSGLRKVVSRKALPSDSAMEAYKVLQKEKGGHLAAFLKTQAPNPAPRVTPGLEDVPLNFQGHANNEALRALGQRSSVKKPERALNTNGGEGSRPLGEQWRPATSDSNYVAPLRISSRSALSGVPLLGMPVPGEMRGKMVYSV